MLNDKRLDEILDRALAHYSDVEPLAGLEDRVLQRILAGRVPAKRPTVLGWAVAGSCLALLFAVVVVLGMRHTTPTPWNAALTSAAPPRSTPIPNVAAPPVLRRVATSHVVAAKRLPKQADFPTRTPMTVEEKALVSFVTRSPETAAKLFSEWQHNATEP
ncbi:MAG TPA: hypothetical protein VFA65_13835, partial [Bryobacteraceae bacterium]|nr:hypothetical protein [Bryobacteraceae bacterium]